MGKVKRTPNHWSERPLSTRIGHKIMPKKINSVFGDDFGRAKGLVLVLLGV